MDQGLRSPGWMTVAVILGAVFLVTPVLTINEIFASRAATFTIAVFFVLTGFIAFNFKPGTARVFVLLIWVGLGAALWLGGREGQTGTWVIVGIAALAGAEWLSRACESIRSTATTDPVTGLLNRVGLMAECERVVTLCRRFGHPLTIVHIDLDSFKEINDREGHSQGDRILRQCAENWAGVVPDSDVLARIGGDEFLLVLAGSDSDDARQMMGVLKEVSPVDWSYGVAQLAPGEELQACVDRADAELYTDKSASRRS
ncbi:MAG: diguanylate cyclase [Solirubrobacterales bacterium]|nr:diguanylate cyclase [Solirubrobacterales bacterium]